MTHFDKTSDLLYAAHDEMFTRGQSKLYVFDPDGSVCELGGLFAALGFNEMSELTDEAWKAIRPASQALQDAMGARGILGTAVGFNARHGLSDCLALYHEAALIAKKAGD